ncbi:MAG: isoprenylcysteine carboxylmethyltransferase family protein [Saprospiraceae bacterium]|nr:isoprenylcysteine carboxylmethyltransferase family protein [Saprospiraceae bacterium]
MAYLFHLGAMLLTLLSLALFGIFLMDLSPVWGINRPEALSADMALLTDLFLILQFGLQHSVMARQSFKKRLTRILAPKLERSVYILASALSLILIVWFWQSMDGMIWEVESKGNIYILHFFFGVGCVFAGIGVVSIKGADFLGFQQFRVSKTTDKIEHPMFQTPFIYRVVRHPIYFGTLLVLWVHPQMSFGHFVLALGMTAYIIIGIYYEEKDLVRIYGNQYRKYQERVPMLIPGVMLGW